MPLTIARKKELVEELESKFEKSEWCLLADSIGLTVSEVNDLRRNLREKNVDYKIYKNTLIKRAIEKCTDDEGLDKLIESLKGPTGVAFTNEDPIVATKVFADFMKENEKLSFKAAIYQGDFWDKGKTTEMAKLGSMAAIYGQLIYAMQGPLYKLLNVLTAQPNELILTLKATAEKVENK